MPTLHLGDDIESPGQRFLRILRFHYPELTNNALSRLIGCTERAIELIDAGSRSGYELVRKHARQFRLNPEDLNASPFSLDRVLSSHKALITFLGVEPDQELRLWIVRLLTMIRDERSKRYRYLLMRKQLLDDSAKRRHLLRRLSIEYKTSEESILRLIQQSPLWARRFEERLNDEVIRIKENGRRRLPKKRDKAVARGKKGAINRKKPRSG